MFITLLVVTFAIAVTVSFLVVRLLRRAGAPVAAAAWMPFPVPHLDTARDDARIDDPLLRLERARLDLGRFPGPEVQRPPASVGGIRGASDPDNLDLLQGSGGS